MKTQEITTHVEQALLLFMEQFKGKEKLESLLASYIQEVQELEGALYDLFSERLLETAIGAQLDQLGRAVGQERIGGDDYYRQLIRARIAINRSNGQIGEMLNIFVLVWDSLYAFEIEEPGPASMNVRMVGQASLSPVNDPELLHLLATAAKAGGVALQTLYTLSPEAETFQLSSQSDTLETSSTQGLANAAQTTGGNLAGVIG